MLDYSLWLGTLVDYETNLVMVEAKKPDSLKGGMLQYLAYMGMIHHTRKTSKMYDTCVYGVATDSFEWQFIHIRDIPLGRNIAIYPNGYSNKEWETRKAKKEYVKISNIFWTGEYRRTSDQSYAPYYGPATSPRNYDCSPGRRHYKPSRLTPGQVRALSKNHPSGRAIVPLIERKPKIDKTGLQAKVSFLTSIELPRKDNRSVTTPLGIPVRGVPIKTIGS